jgi:ABC-type nitrate/sulfonate/bicarbonate transport system permease component
MATLTSGSDTVATAAAARRRAAGRRRVALRASGWLGVLVLAAIWQLAASAIDSPVFPTFTTTVHAAVDVVRGPELTRDIVPSIERALLGFAISGVLGLVIGLTLGYVRALGDCFATLLDFLRSMPSPLFVPLAIVLFGIGGKMVIIIVITGAIWPVLLNAYDAARRIEPLYLDTARANGLHGIAMFRQVLLPATLPSTFAGLRLALSTSLAVLVVAEILGAHSGIGYFVQYTQQTFLIPQTYAGVLILAALGWLFDTAFLFAERRLLRWERALTGGNRV